MAEPKKTALETAVSPEIHTSMAETLEKLFGHKLMPEELELLKKRMGGEIPENEGLLEDSLIDYMELIKAWQGAAIVEVIQPVQDALRGFIPTGDGVVDETLTMIMSKLMEISRACENQLATPEQWQEFYDVLNQTNDLVKDKLSKAPNVDAKKIEAAHKHIEQAILVMHPERKIAAQLLTTPINIESATKPTIG